MGTRSTLAPQHCLGVVPAKAAAASLPSRDAKSVWAMQLRAVRFQTCRTTTYASSRTKNPLVVLSLASMTWWIGTAAHEYLTLLRDGLLFLRARAGAAAGVDTINRAIVATIDLFRRLSFAFTSVLLALACG